MSIKFSNDKPFRLASASADTTARVWDPYTGRCIHVLSGHKEVPPCSQSSTARCYCRLALHPAWNRRLNQSGSLSHSSLVGTVAEDLAAAQPPLSLPDR